jgi:uncharacterized protein YtpQ (UPF0354 family)
MKRFLHSFIGIFGGKKPLLTPAEFTGTYVKAIQSSVPELRVNVLQDLELKVGLGQKNDSTVFLHNAYELYQQSPKELSAIIQRYAASSLDTLTQMDETVDRTRIVPVIKDRAWLEETRQAMLAHGMDKAPEHVWQDFSPDLVILYAEDLPTNIRYLTPDNLKELGLELAELRTLACDNLRRILPDIECKGSDGLYMLTAGGDYEASLLLADKIWSSGQFQVQGEIVVAIPTRDLLLVTGSESTESLEKLRELAKEAYEGGSYRLTPKLFVYRNGKFEWLGPDVALN